MTRDELVKMAIEAGAKPGIDNQADVYFLGRFFDLATAHEREACAKVCEAQQNMAVMRHPARIEVEQSTQNMMALKCAGAIRARGQ